MTWNLELPTQEGRSPLTQEHIQDQDRINELLRVSKRLFTASAVNFAWVDQSSRRFWVAGYTGLDQTYFDEYKAKGFHIDPLGLDVIISSNRQNIFCLSELPYASAWRSTKFLKQHGFNDELNLVLRYGEEPIAILTAFSRSSFKENLNAFAATHRFLELYLDNHPHVRNQVRRRLLEDKYDLTRREIEVVDHILDGASNIEIAERLSISVATVKTHVVRVLSKTNTSNRSELIALLKD